MPIKENTHNKRFHAAKANFRSKGFLEAMTFEPNTINAT